MSEDMQSEVDAWEEPVAPTTIADLTKLCEDLIIQRDIKKDFEDQIDNISEKIKTLESKILLIMQEHKMPKFPCEFGTFSLVTKKSVTQPENLDEKLKLFSYLRDQGCFEEMVSVNSRTLSSWASREIEAKEKEGIFGWAPPGLKPASEHKTLSVRKK